MDLKSPCLIIGLLLGIALFPGAIQGKTGNSENLDKSVEVQYKNPQKSSHQYLEKRPKKKFRAKRKVGGTWDCHLFMYYKSNMQKDREKAIKRTRRKL